MTPDSNSPVAPDRTADDHYVHDVDPSLIAETIEPDAGPVALRNVTKRYGSLIAVHDVTYRVRGGEFHCLAGPNGSGKTTLGKIAVGLTRPTSGEVVVPDGSIGFGFQDPRFYPDLSVRENVEVFCRVAGVSPDSEWVRTILSTLRLSRVERQVAAELSGGFKKKLDLAIALLEGPTYLWLDEPLSDVDDVSEKRIVSLLEMYANAGGGVVVSTHNLELFGDALTHMAVFLDGVSSETVELGDVSRPGSVHRRYETLIETLASTGDPG